MSLVTRCTACGTLFKVVADQLKISDGWVRCGQCATVFDAQSNLVAEPQPTVSPPPARAPSLSAAPSAAPRFAVPPTRAIDSRAYGADSIRDSSSFSALDRDTLLAAFSTGARAPSALQDAELDSLPPDSTPGATFFTQQATQPASLSGFSSGFSQHAQDAVASSPQPAQLGRLKADTRAGSRNEGGLDSGAESKAASQLESPSFRPGALRDSGELDSEAGPSTASWASSEYPLPQARRPADDRTISISAEPTTLNSPRSSDAPQSQLLNTLPGIDMPSPHTTPAFVTQAKRAERWRSPWVRLVLSLLVLALLAGLALQVASQEKDRIAAMHPDAKPWLDQLCQHMGCQVQPLKRLESIAVDASSFNRINKNNASLEAVTQSYKLAVTLKNTGALPLAIPHVELSLQDAQDQTILRRVLSPADLGSARDHLMPSQDMASQITLQIDTAQLAGSRIQGYRVLAFYP